MKNNPGHLNVCVLLALVLGGFALYFTPLHSTSFYFDDVSSIENNEAIKKIDIPRIFNAFNTRSLVGLSFALNYRWCGLHPEGYRLIDLLIHCLNAFLVYLLIKSTLELNGDSLIEWASFFGSMLFLCHPIQTEPVNYITQRFVLMGSFFYLLTLFLYIQYRCRSKKRYMLAALGSAIAAMFCKEFVVTLPLMLALYDFYFLPNETIRKRCKSLLPFFAIVLIVPFLLLRTPPQAIGVANIANSNFTHHIDITRAQGGISRKQYFLTELNVVRTYVRLLFLPVNQNLDYDYPLSYKMDTKTLLSAIFLICLLAMAAITYKPYRIVSFGILWFFIALSVESSFIPIGHVIAEYRLYLASVGFVFLVMILLYTRPLDQKKLNTIAIIILMGFSVLTYQRNKVWKNEFSLWDDTAKKSPHKARAYNNRGLIWAQQGNLTQAISDYNKAIEVDPYYINAYINRGFTYNKEGNFVQALSDYNKAITLNPKLAEAYSDRGNTYYYQGNFASALSDYNKAITLEPKLAEAYSDRGNAYLKLSDFTQAISDYNKAIELKPDFTDAYYNLAFIYYKQGNLTQAISNYSKVIEINPNDTQAYNNRAVCYYRLKEYGKTTH